jgi:hypothetical protein
LIVGSVLKVPWVPLSNLVFDLGGSRSMDRSNCIRE